MGFEIDKITNSIEDALTGESLDTDVQEADRRDLKAVMKKAGWRFNWKKEFNQTTGKIYKLVINGDSTIQGLICIEAMEGWVEMHLIEAAPQNCGQGKRYLGVAGNLVAFACRQSFDLGFDGYVAFVAKTSLIRHYEQTLGAELMFKTRMKIGQEAAKNLVNSYYQDYFK